MNDSEVHWLVRELSSMYEATAPRPARERREISDVCSALEQLLHNVSAFLLRAMRNGADQSFLHPRFTFAPGFSISSTISMRPSWATMNNAVTRFTNVTFMSALSSKRIVARPPYPCRHAVTTSVLWSGPSVVPMSLREAAAGLSMSDAVAVSCRAIKKEVFPKIVFLATEFKRFLSTFGYTHPPPSTRG